MLLHVSGLSDIENDSSETQVCFLQKKCLCLRRMVCLASEEAISCRNEQKMALVVLDF